MDEVVQKSTVVITPLEHLVFPCVLPPMKTTSPPLPTTLDVLIIGAGAAGISAARRLVAARLSVLVVESRDRVGGRASTQYWSGHGLDLGCGWLHSADENLLTPLAREQGFTVDQTPPPWFEQAFDLGLSKAEQAQFMTAWEAFEDRLSDAAAQGQDRPASDLFDPDSRWNARIDAISGAMNGARFAQVSTIDHAAYHDTGVNWRVVEGYGTLIERLSETVPIRLDCPVERIDRTGPILRIDTARGRLEARCVILTVPTSLIASEAIRIDPPVPDLIDAAAGVPLGLASKLHLSLDGADEFPKDSQLWGRDDTAQTGGYHLRPFGRPMIEGYFGGELAWGLEAQGEAAFTDFAVSELVSLLGSSFRKRLHPVATSMWGADPWSGGAYSHALPGHAGDRERLSRPIEDRIFIAGEATAPTFFGTAHGAWLEGERAAVQAITALGVDARLSGAHGET